jgi:hypothetical protein
MLFRCIDGACPDGAAERPAPLPRRTVRRRAASRAALVGRLWRAAEQQIDEIELRMRAAGLASADREGNARTFATLVKTLRELAAFDEAQRARKPTSQTMDDDDDPIPRDIEEFRRELARRIESFIEDRSDPGVPGGSGS